MKIRVLDTVNSPSSVVPVAASIVPHWTRHGQPWVSPWVGSTHGLGWVGSKILKVGVDRVELGYIFIFCFENDGYKFYNSMNPSQTCANGAQIVTETNTFTS